jgi:hypothetical protein
MYLLDITRRLRSGSDLWLIFRCDREQECQNETVVCTLYKLMSAASMYDEEHFVVLETDRPEEILTVAELSEKLRSMLATRQNDLPPDVKQAGTIDEQIRYLIDTTCELDMAPGEYLQWYAIRLEK